MKMTEKKERDKQAELLEKIKFLEHIFDNYFENQSMSVGLMKLLYLKQLSF